MRPSLAFILVSILAALALEAGDGSAARATTLTARVGPHQTLSLRMPSGKPVSRLTVGAYVIVVHDRSSSLDFHLAGSGLNAFQRATRLAFVGTKTWRVWLPQGKYTYFSDGHRDTLAGRFVVTTRQAKHAATSNKRR